MFEQGGVACQPETLTKVEFLRAIVLANTFVEPPLWDALEPSVASTQNPHTGKAKHLEKVIKSYWKSTMPEDLLKTVQHQTLRRGWELP